MVLNNGLIIIIILSVFDKMFPEPPIITSSSRPIVPFESNPYSETKPKIRLSTVEKVSVDDRELIIKSLGNHVSSVVIMI